MKALLTMHWQRCLGTKLGLTGTDGNDACICKISPKTGSITEYQIPTPGAFPLGITTGPDGNLWFTENSGEQIGKISPITGNIIEYHMPVIGDDPENIITSPGGDLWFTESDGDIGAISPVTGVIALYPAGGNDITTGPDGNLWFTEVCVNEIGTFSPNNAWNTTDYFIRTTNSDPIDIAMGPDGNLWFTNRDGSIGKLSPLTGKITEYPVPN
jgi:streptogramin lyase